MGQVRQELFAWLVDDDGHEQHDKPAEFVGWTVVDWTPVVDGVVNERMVPKYKIFQLGNLI